MFIIIAFSIIYTNQKKFETKFFIDFVKKIYEVFNVIISLLYGKNLIATQGISCFLNFLKGFQEKTKVKLIRILFTK